MCKKLHFKTPSYYTCSLLMCTAVLQIRRGKRDYLEIIFHKTPLKHMLRPIIRTVLPRGVTTYVFVEK